MILVHGYDYHRCYHVLLSLVLSLFAFTTQTVVFVEKMMITFYNWLLFVRKKTYQMRVTKKCNKMFCVVNKYSAWLLSCENMMH